jgi:uncharacterized membrane protein
MSIGETLSGVYYGLCDGTAKHTVPGPLTNMPPRYLLLLVLLGALLIAVIQLEVISIALQKLGLSQHSALLLMLGVLLGSGINIPLGSITSRPGTAPPPDIPFRWRVRWQPVMPPATGRTVIAVNLGGCVIPSAICMHLLAARLVDPLDLLLALPVISAVCYLFSRPVTGIGVAMPVLLAPLAAVLVALALEPENAAPLAYSSGVLGVLVGADLLRLPDIRSMGVPVAAIGGAGTFDGIFLTGIIAVLLT